MIITESELRRIIRQEIINESLSFDDILLEGDLLEEGVLGDLLEKAGKVALAASLTAALAACGGGVNVRDQVRRSFDDAAAAADSDLSEAGGDQSDLADFVIQKRGTRRSRIHKRSGSRVRGRGGRKRFTSSYSRNVQKDLRLLKAIAAQYKTSETLLEAMSQGFARERVKSDPGSGSSVTDQDIENARVFIVTEMDKALSTRSGMKIQRKGAELYQIAKQMGK